MTQFASPVLHTLLDTDAYKLHMQQAVFHHYHDVHVAAEFRCRGDDLLGIYADSIREQVEAMQHLALTDDEYQWLSGLPFFKADYLNWLREFRYKPEQVTVTNDNGKLFFFLSVFRLNCCKAFQQSFQHLDVMFRIMLTHKAGT